MVEKVEKLEEEEEGGGTRGRGTGYSRRTCTREGSRGSAKKLAPLIFAAFYFRPRFSPSPPSILPPTFPLSPPRFYPSDDGWREILD